jgi:hypothetical protein
MVDQATRAPLVVSTLAALLSLFALPTAIAQDVALSEMPDMLTLKINAL